MIYPERYTPQTSMRKIAKLGAALAAVGGIIYGIHSADKLLNLKPPEPKEAVCYTPLAKPGDGIDSLARQSVTAGVDFGDLAYEIINDRGGKVAVMIGEMLPISNEEICDARPDLTRAR